jgi:hypothetical protein
MKHRLLVLFAVLLAACDSPFVTPPCDADSRFIDPSRVRGRYDVAFSRDATSAVVGSLSLDSASGFLDVDQSALGVVVPGDPRAVSVFVTGVTGSPNVILRIGSVVLPPGALLFDGAYFTMFVERLDENGMAGSWRSSSAQPMMSEASGRFCATRLGA